MGSASTLTSTSPSTPLFLVFAVYVVGVGVGLARANYPLFDVATRFRVLLIPRDTAVGTVVYRLRATDSDFDYPLHFDVAGDRANARASVLRVDNLPCRRNMSYCQANLVLARRLEPGRVYDVRLRVRDSRGDATSIDAVVQASNSSAPQDAVFPHRPAVIMVPEDTKPGTELEYVIARKNPSNNRHAVIELWGSPLFMITQKLSSPSETNASIILNGDLDYETQTMYTLQIYALDAFAELGQDTRNVAALQVAVVVEDVQDTPPEFVEAPPVTELRPDLKVGDVVTRVRAEDGDKGRPRALRYGLVSEGSPLTPFFTIDETNGIVRLAKPLSNLTSVARAHQPLLLTIMAEEVRTGLEEPPAMASTVTIALLLGAAANTPPYFDHKNYVTRLAENSPQGTPLVFGDPYTTIVRDDDQGKLGVFSLELANNNGTFEVVPAVGQQRVMFVIHVRNPTLLDYETTKSIVFRIVARERTPNSSLSDTAEVLVYLDDINDNPPEFAQDVYRVSIPENVTAGTTVTQVKAVDVDTGSFGQVRYTAILGAVNTSLSLDPDTGVIKIATNRHALDREVAQEYRLEVEARDENGAGLRSTVPLIIRVLDVNDETPTFDREPFEFILAPDRTTFSSPAFVHANDLDAEPPNNVVRYEILSGNLGEHFHLNRETGEVTVKKAVPSRETVFTINIRAYDLGVPLRWSHGIVRVYPPDTRARTMVFIVPGANPDIRTTEEMLSALTGGTVTVKDIRPYEDDTMPAAIPRSQVTATVLYSGESIIDVEGLQRRLKGNKSGIIVNEAVKEQKADSGSALMWILIVLGLLLLLAVLLIVLCCLCHGCPLHIGSSKRRKTSRVHSAENAHLVVRESVHGHDSKGVQAGWLGGLKEAWSAGTPSTVAAAVPVPAQGQTHPLPPPPIVVLQRETPVRSRPRSARSTASAGISDVGIGGGAGGNRPPAIVFTKRLQQMNAAGNTTAAAAAEQSGQLFVEDLDGTEYRVLDPSRFVFSTAAAHPPSRSSAVSERPATPPVPPSSPPDHAHQPAALHLLVVERTLGELGKSDASDHLLRVRDEQHLNRSPGNESLQYEHEPRRTRQPLFLREGDAEIMRLVTRDGSVAGEQGDSVANSPGRVAAAAAAAVGRSYPFVPEASYPGKDIIMRRFMEDQRAAGMEDLEATADPDSFLIAGLSELVQQQRQRAAEDQLRERDRERDSLLQRFLQEESRRNAQARRRILASLEVEHDTQSLPPSHIVHGQATASMWTQTNVDSATQTEAEPHLLRPPRRRVRSDNDESPSPTEAEDEGCESQRSNTARSYSRGRERRSRRSRRIHKVPRRHIKTPILEENESPLEAGERRSRTARSRTNNTGTQADDDKTSSAEKTAEIGADDSLEADSLDDAQHEPRTKRSPEDHEDDSNDGDANDLKDGDHVEKSTESPVNRLTVQVESSAAAGDELKSPSRRSSNASGRVVSFGEKLRYVKGDTYMSWYKKKREEREQERKKKQEAQGKTAKPRKANVTTVEPQPRTNRATEARRALATSAMKNAESARSEAHFSDNRSIPPVSVNSNVGESGRSAIFQEMARPNPGPGSGPTNSNSVVRILSRQISEDDAIRRINAGGPLQVTSTQTKVDDDKDSGIAMSSLFRGASATPNIRRGRNAQLMEKKSIFTIAYDEMHTQQLRPDSTTPPA